MVRFGNELVVCLRVNGSFQGSDPEFVTQSRRPFPPTLQTNNKSGTINGTRYNLMHLMGTGRGKLQNGWIEKSSEEVVSGINSNNVKEDISGFFWFSLFLFPVFLFDFTTVRHHLDIRSDRFRDLAWWQWRSWGGRSGHSANSVNPVLTRPGSAPRWSVPR